MLHFPHFECSHFGVELICFQFVCSNTNMVIVSPSQCFGHVNVAVDVLFLGATAAKCSLSMVPGSSAGTAMTLTSVKIALKLANTTPDIRLAE